ncbi:hypothetical protein M2359_003627 [Gordonia amarae]|nr:hypothetical protein [Gordonia amarae]
MPAVVKATESAPAPVRSRAVPYSCGVLSIGTLNSSDNAGEA